MGAISIFGFTHPSQATLDASSLGGDQHGALHDHLAHAAAASITHLRASDPAFGLGTGVADKTALNAFYAALPGAFTQPGLDRSGLGVLGEIPPGVYNGDPLGHLILAPASGVGGDLIVAGQGAGGTTLTLPNRGTIGGVPQGCMGSAQNLSSATRSGNTFTLGFSAPWFASAPTLGTAPTSIKPLCQPLDVLVVQVLNLGVLEWAHYTVTANNVAGDYSKIQYQAFEAGMAVDGCIPPTGQAAYFPGIFINPLNFRNPHEIFFRGLELASGSNTGTPLDGIGIRWASRCHIEPTVRLTGWWAATMINGSGQGGQGAQNTDHSWLDGCVFTAGNAINTLILSNSSNAYVDNGGGRDNHWRGIDGGAPNLYHIVCADDGNIETGDFEGANFKSGYAVVRGEGIWGVPRAEPEVIDGLEGMFKTESQGNLVYDDASGTGTYWGWHRVGHRFEAGISINGQGNPTNFTYQPYTLTAVTLVGGVMTATINETGHGIVVGTALQIGNGSNATTTVASGSNNAVLPQASIHVASTTGFPTAGVILVVSTTGQQLITYSGVSGGNTFTGCTGGKGKLLTAAAVISQVFNGESRVATLDSTGQTITLPFPQYTGADVTSPGTATCGRIGFAHVGTWDRGDYQVDWDNQGNDRYVQAGSSFELNTLRPFSIRMIQDDQASAPRRSLPSFRIRDAEPIGGTHGACVVSGSVFSSTETKFTSLDVGKTITCANVAGGAAAVAAFIDVNHVAMTGAVTAGTGLTWSMSDAQGLDDPRFRLERGMNLWGLEFHSGADANAIVAGNLVELLTSTGGTLKVRRSTGVKTALCAGVAMTGSPATPGRVSVTTNGLTGTSARILFNSPAILVMKPGSTATLGDDLTPLTSTGTIAAGTLLVDNGDGTVIAWDGTTTGLRVVGQAIKAASGGFVGARLCAPYWT